MNTETYTNDVRKIFWKCGACSHTFFYLLNREFGHLKEIEEKASDLLAGGLSKTGHQCGMLWGCSLAVGAESFRICSQVDKAIATTITSTQHIIKSFVNKTKSPDCLDITGCNFMKISGMLKLSLKIIFTGNQCFKLAEEWAPDAIKSARESLKDNQQKCNKTPLSCASEVLKKMGASIEEQVMVAGFAGGLGLSGNACGALAAAVWIKMVEWCRKHPQKKPSYFNNEIIKDLFKTFYSVTDREILCSKICGRQFNNIDEHTEFVNNDGCDKIIKVLSET